MGSETRLLGGRYGNGAARCGTQGGIQGCPEDRIGTRRGTDEAQPRTAIGATAALSCATAGIVILCELRAERAFIAQICVANPQHRITRTCPKTASRRTSNLKRRSGCADSYRRRVRNPTTIPSRVHAGLQTGRRDVGWRVEVRDGHGNHYLVVGVIGFCHQMFEVDANAQLIRAWRYVGDVDPLTIEIAAVHILPTASDPLVLAVIGPLKSAACLRVFVVVEQAKGLFMATRCDCPIGSEKLVVCVRVEVMMHVALRPVEVLGVGLVGRCLPEEHIRRADIGRPSIKT